MSIYKLKNHTNNKSATSSDLLQLAKLFLVTIGEGKTVERVKMKKSGLFCIIRVRSENEKDQFFSVTNEDGFNTTDSFFNIVQKYNSEKI
jgi:hypothetical protein